MANTLIKGLAITLGGGIAVGLGIKIGQSSAPAPMAQEAVDFGPVLDRIEGVENRIVSVESAQQAAVASMKEAGPMVIPSVAELEERVNTHGSEVEALRAAIQRATEKHDTRIEDLGHAVSNLESKLPELIDRTVKPKLEEMHNRLQREMQETAGQTLEMFADRIQARVVEKITSIEGDLGRQSEAINDLRDYSLKTDQNLQRLLAGVENLADKINRKFEAPAEPARSSPPQRQAPVPSAPAPQAGGGMPGPPASQSPASQPPAFQPPVSQPKPTEEARMSAPITAAAVPALAPTPDAAPAPKPASFTGPFPGAPAVQATDFPSRIELGEAANVRPPREIFQVRAPKSFSGPEFEDVLAVQHRSNGLRRAALAGGGIAVMATVLGGIEFSGVLNKTSAHSIGTSSKASAPVAVVSTDALDIRKLTDQSELLDRARAFSQNKELDKAEDIYRSILRADPGNTEVKRMLASVLFREEKIEESAKIINSISEDKKEAGTDPQQ